MQKICQYDHHHGQQQLPYQHYEGFSTPNGTPVDVGVDANGFIFVVDQTGSRVHIYETFDGVNTPALLATFGSAGSGDGQFSNPTSVAFDSSNRIYIGDGSNRSPEFAIVSRARRRSRSPYPDIFSKQGFARGREGLQ